MIGNCDKETDVNSKLIFYSNLEFESSQKTFKYLNETIFSNIDNKKSYLNTGFKINLLLIKNNDSIQESINNKNDQNKKIKSKFFSKIFEWNINHNAESFFQLSSIKKNFIATFTDIKDFFIVNKIKKDLSLNVLNLVNWKTSLKIKFIKELETHIKILNKTFIGNYSELLGKCYSFLHFKYPIENRSIQNNENDISLFPNFEGFKNEFNLLFKECNLDTTNINSLDQIGFIALNNKNKKFIFPLSKFIIDSQGKISQNLPKLDSFLINIILNNDKKLNIFFQDFVKALNSSIFYSEYLEYIQDEEFNFKANINHIIQNILKSENKSIIGTMNDSSNTDYNEIFESVFLKLMHNNVDFKENLFNFEYFFGVQNLKLFINENFEINALKAKLDDEKLIKLYLWNKLFFFKTEIINFLKMKICNGLNTKEFDNIEKLSSYFRYIFFEIKFKYKSNLIKKGCAEFSLSFNYFCEFNIFYIENYDESKLIKNQINKTLIQKNEKSLITSKILILKTFNISFTYQTVQTSNPTEGKEKRNKLQIADLSNFTVLFNDCFYFDEETNSILNLLLIDKNCKENLKSTVNNESNNNNINKSNLLKTFKNKITRNEIIITKTDSLVTLINYTNHIYNEIDEVLDNLNKHENAKSDTFSKLDTITNIMYTYDIINKRIYFGEIKKQKNLKEKGLIYEKAIKNPDLLHLGLLYGSNNFEFNMESNLNKILQKNKSDIFTSENILSEKKEDYLLKYGFGIELYNYSFFDKNEQNSNEYINENEKKAFDYFIGLFENNQLEGNGIHSNKDFFYFGEFNNSFKNGFGYISLKIDNDLYIGELKKNIMKGKGIYKYNENPIVNLYLGEFDNNHADGKGVIVFNNNDYYYGNFKENIKILDGYYMNLNKDGFYVSFKFDEKGNENSDLTKYTY